MCIFISSVPIPILAENLHLKAKESTLGLIYIHPSISDEITLAPPPPNAVGPKRRSFMHSLPQFLEVPFTPLFLQRSSIAVPVSNNKRNSSASFNKIEVVEMEVRRTNPGFIGKAKMNTIKMSIAMVGAFLACWTPYYVMCIW